MSQSTVEMRAAAGGVAGVELDRVVRLLGGKRVLDGVDLRVPVRGRFGIVGRSGWDGQTRFTRPGCIRG
jgi:ABC-type transporter Mla maintaining outer membrane lipid asymmetry ATPase subunit MlaF